MRKAAAQEFRTSDDVKSAIDQLVENADKLLKGAEAYLANLLKESRPLDEKVTSWTKILDKVDTKFTSYLRDIEDIVNTWQTSHLDREREQVVLATEPVKNIAESGQADVGYGYVWLADVTYLDWQRYHDLKRKSDDFTDLAYSIQNGSHPSPPIDPVQDAIHEFHLEVEEVIIGFETRFRHIKRNGLRALGSALGEMNGDEDVEQDTGLPQSPDKVSILPIPGDDSTSAFPISESDFPVVGRGKVEVEEALERAESVLTEKHEEVPTDDEVDPAPHMDTSTATPSSVSPLHAEL